MEEKSGKRKYLQFDESQPVPSTPMKKIRIPLNENVDDSVQSQFSNKLNKFQNFKAESENKIRGFQECIDELIKDLENLKSFANHNNQKIIKNWVKNQYEILNKIKDDLMKIFNLLCRSEQEIDGLKRGETSEISIATLRKLQKLEKETNAILKNLPNLEKRVNILCITVKDKFEQIKTKTSPSVKRTVTFGEDYQKIITILLRERGLNVSGSEVGSEVAGAGQLDDIVYVYAEERENKYRFFQVKHMNNQKPNPVLVTDELFKRLGEKTKSDFHLLRYFLSFCKIKQCEKFKNKEIEMTLITNRDIKFVSETEKLLLKEDVVEDKCLSLREREIKKYYLNVEAVVKDYSNDLKPTSYVFCKNSEENPDSIIREFLNKISIVVDYPSIEELRQQVFEEVFEEDVYNCKDKKILQNYLMYVETELLQFEEEIVSRETWNEKKEQLRNYINMQRVIGISNWAKEKIKSNVSSKLKKIEKHVSLDPGLYQDMMQFVQNKNCTIKICIIESLLINAAVVFNILEKLKKKNNGNVNELYFYCTDLFEVKFVYEYLKSDKTNNIFVLIYKHEKCTGKLKVLTEKLSSITHLQKKILLLSDKQNNFTKEVKKLFKDRCELKEYQLGFKYLSQSSKEEFLSMDVSFQGKTLPLNQIVSERLANEAFDLNCLCELSKDNKIDSKESFQSPGFNEDYYISRKFFKRKIKMLHLKRTLSKHLFFLTWKNDDTVIADVMKSRLTEKGILENNIYKWKDGETINGKNGIILFDSQTASCVEVFNKLTTVHKNVSWLMVENTLEHFFVVENNIIPTFELNIEDELTIIEESTLDYNSLGDTVILVGNSGSGKSTLLTSVSRKIKESKNVWVSKINLRTCSIQVKFPSVKELNKPIVAIDTIVAMICKNRYKFHLEKNVLKEGLKQIHKGEFNIVILLDGFNELSEIVQKIICTLIKTLLKKCNVKQVWITTQRQEKTKLESNLKVAAFSLKTFKVQDQLDFMVKYWKVEYNKSATFYRENELYEDAKLALEKLKKHMGHDANSFTEVALYIKMLADILLSSNRRIDDSVNFADFFGTFVQHKICVYKQETSLRTTTRKRHSKEFNNDNEGDEENCSINEDAMRKLFEGQVRQIHQEESVRVILSNYNTKKTNYSAIIKHVTAGRSALITFQKFVGIEVSKKILSKIGLLMLKHEEFDFSHYTFAQFFFSEYLIRNLNDIKLHRMLIELVMSERALKPCREFLNKMLTNYLPFQNNHGTHGAVDFSSFKLGPKAVDILMKEIYNVSILIRENLEHLVLLLLKGLGSHECKQKLEAVINGLLKATKVAGEVLTNTETIGWRLDYTEGASGNVDE